MLRKLFNPMIAITLFFIAFTSCDSESEQEELNNNVTEVAAASKVTISDETINGIINSIPSPLETVSLIRENGLEYNELYLNPIENYENYKSKYEIAFAIGAYSADLGYLNLYDKNLAAIKYIGVVTKLSEKLNIRQFFDYEMLKRLASNKKNLDSLLYISTSCFNKMDAFLRTNKRSEQSALIITGAWLEGLYFETEMAKQKPSQKIKENIGSQKTAINNIMAILNAYKDIEYFNNFHKQMQKLEQLYEKVNITYNYKEPKVKEINGELIVEDQSETKIEISDSVFKEILDITGNIRKDILNAGGKDKIQATNTDGSKNY
jgi:hypothetical protein